MSKCHQNDEEVTRMNKLAGMNHAAAAVPRGPTGRENTASNVLPIGPVLRRLRGERSLRDVERDTGIANSRLCNIERGSQQPGLKFLGRMADYYRTSVAEIIRQAEHLRDCGPDSHGAMDADVERSYQSVTEDPRLQPWNERDDALPVEAKRQVVRMYELLTGKTLLN